MKFFILMSEVLSLHAYAKKTHAYIEGFWISLSLPFLSEVKAQLLGGVSAPGLGPIPSVIFGKLVVRH